MKNKDTKRPKSRKAIRLRKARTAKTIRSAARKSGTIATHSKNVHPEASSLQGHSWEGLLTLRFESHSHSKDTPSAHSKRLAFLHDYMNNLRVKFGISDRELNWVACEEFGTSGTGHFHVLFSFDKLRAKGREDKIPRTDFSGNGDFSRGGRESVDFICQKLGLNPHSVLFDWEPTWKNAGLVDYFCKIETDRPEKCFIWAPFWEKRGILNAA